MNLSIISIDHNGQLLDWPALMSELPADGFLQGRLHEGTAQRRLADNLMEPLTVKCEEYMRK